MCFVLIYPDDSDQKKKKKINDTSVLTNDVLEHVTYILITISVRFAT